MAATALLTPGCAVIHDLATDPEEKAPSLVGRHISELEAVTSIHLHRGRLLVALTDGFERPYSLAGIAVVDTATDTVISHYNPFGDQWQVPQAVASFRDNLLFAVSHEGRARVADTTGVWNDIQPTYPWNSGQPELTMSGDRAYLTDRFDGRLFSVSGTLASPAFQVDALRPLRAVAVTQNTLYALREYSRKLYRVTGTTVDSVDLTGLSGKPGLKCSPDLVVAHGNRVFITLSVTDSLNVADTTLVAVIDAATLATDTILKLKYPYHSASSGYMFTPTIVNGKLYLTRRLPPPQVGSGVEVLDLDDLSNRGVAITHEETGGQIHDFLPAGPGKAYTLQSPLQNSSWSSHGVRRVAY